MKRFRVLACIPVIFGLVHGDKTMAADWIGYVAGDGPGAGKHVVFLAGDEEYRSEEGLPMLAKILSQRHGFRCTVLFSVDDEGLIDPENQASLSNPKALDSADAIVMLLRFREWPDSTMNHFVDAFHRGLPIIALRTSTHAFQYSDETDSRFREYTRFGERVLGEEWVSHWGHHKEEAMRGIVEPSAKNHPILQGVYDVFADSDVYEAYPPDDATILMRGQVLEGMNPSDPPSERSKRRRSDGKTQPVNDPMMPVAWTRLFPNSAGTTNRIFCTTMGAATDLQSEGLRRLIVNAVYWGLKMDIPDEADVAYVDDYKPTFYGFGAYRRGIQPADHAIGKVLPEGSNKD